MSFVTLQMDITVKGFEINTQFDAHYSVENNSIGSYEYWGQKCYDHQPDYLICEQVSDIKVLNKANIYINPSKKLKAEIETLLLDTYNDDIVSELESELAGDY